MADKIAILVQLNDTEAKRKIKALKDDLKQLEKGVTIKITASTVEKAQRDTTALNRNLDEVQKSRSVNVSPGTLGSVGQAATQVARVLHELERPHQVNVTMGAIQGPIQQLGIAQQLGMPSAFEQSVRSWVQATYGINKQLPAEYYGNFYRGFTTNASGAGKDYADVTWYGKGGVQLPAVVGQFTDPFRAAYESMQGTMEQAEKEWGEWTEFMHDPAWNNIPQKYWEKHVEGAKEAKREAVSLSQVLTGIGSGFSTVGGALQGIGNLFSFDLLGTVERTLTAYGTVLATQGFGKAVERYDIMSTYPKYMELMGVSAEVADASLAKINENIQGIPVGLDQAAQEIRMFTMYLEGTEDSMDEVAGKATDMAIGLEKALVAGGAAEYMQTTARYEINRLLATGSLGTSRQWQALINGLGVSSGYLRKAMGYGDLSNRDFISRLSLKDDDENKITTEEFLNGLAMLADYEDLNDAIEVYKSTISAWIKNITFAMARGFENVFKAVNETLGNALGEDEGIVGQMEHIRNAINTIFLDASDWIREHPELITGFFDRLNEVISRAKELNVGEVVLDIAEQMGKMFDVFLKVYDALPSDFWKNLFVFSTTWATPLGKVFSGIGSVFTTLGRLSGLLSKLPLIGRLFNIFSLFAPKGVTINGVGGFKALAGGIASIAAMGGIILEYGYVFKYLSDLELGPNLKDNLLKVIAAVGAVGTLTGSLSVAFSTFKGEQLKDLFGGELATGGLIALVGAAGLVIGEFAHLAQDIASLDLTNYQENMDKLSVFVGAVAGILGATVAVGTGVAASGIGLVGVLAGELVAAGILGELWAAAQIIGAFADVAQEIANIDLGNNFSWKVESFGRAIGNVYHAFPKLEPDDTQKSWNYKRFFENVGDAIAALQKSADALSAIEGKLNWLNRREGKFQEIKGKVVEFAQGVGDIFDAFKEAFGENGYVEEKATAHHAKIIENMGVATDNLSALATKMSELDHAMDEANLGLEGEAGSHIETEWRDMPDGSSQQFYRRTYNDRYQNFIKRVKEMVQGVKTITDLFSGESDDELGRWINSVLSNWSSSNEAKSIANLLSVVTSIKDIGTRISEASQLIADLVYKEEGTAISAAGSGYGLSTVDVYRQNVQKMLQGIYGLFMDENDEPIMAKFNDIPDMTNLVQQFSNIKTIFGTEGIRSIVNTMDGLTDKLASITKNGTVGHLGLVMLRLAEMFNNWTLEDDEDGSTTLAQAENLKQAIDQMSEMIDTLMGMQESVDKLWGDETSIGQKVGDLVNAMFGALNVEGADEFTARVDEMHTMISSVTDLLTTLSEISLEDLNTEVKQLIDYLANQMNEQMRIFAEKMDTAKDSARKLSVQIDAVKNSMAYAHSHFSTMMSDLASLSGSFDSTRKAAENLSNAISSIQSNVSVNVTSNMSDSILFPRLGLATGGPVGTDTIPAWLSPGEFVMRSKAVQTFGQQFMAQVNALNIPGALNALVRHYTLPQSAQVSNISNRDNHAVVNQYISTNNPNYTYARASKYVRAL